MLASKSIPRIRPLQGLVPLRTLVLLLPAVLTNRGIVVVKGLRVVLPHDVLAIDAIRKVLLGMGKCHVVTFLHLEWFWEVFVVVVAG